HDPRVNRYLGNLSPIPGRFPDYPAPVRTCAQVVMKSAVRLHCHSAPNLGSETDCGRPTDTAAPAITSTKAETIVSFRKMEFIAGLPISTQEVYASRVPLLCEPVHNFCKIAASRRSTRRRCR